MDPPEACCLALVIATAPARPVRAARARARADRPLAALVDDPSPAPASRCEARRPANRRRQHFRLRSVPRGARTPVPVRTLVRVLLHGVALEEERPDEVYAMENILDITAVAFQGDAMRRLSSVLHESQNATQRGIETAVPASLAGLAAHAATEQKAEELLGRFRVGDYPHVEPGAVTTMVDDPATTARIAQSGQGFLSRIFGPRLDRVIDALAGQAGLSRASASTLLGLATPVVLDAIGKEAEARHLDARGLARFLADQGRAATSTLPGSLSTVLGARELTGGTGSARTAPAAPKNVGVDIEQRVGSVLGKARGRMEGAMDDTETRSRALYEEDVSRRTRKTEYERAEQRRGIGWLLGGLLLLVFLSLLLFRSRAPNHVVAPPVPNVRTPEMPVPQLTLPQTAPRMEGQKVVPQGPGPVSPGQAAPEVLSLDTGVSPLSSYLASSDPAPRRFVLRGLEFTEGTGAISEPGVLDQAAAIIHSNPKAKIRIEGHTAATGSEQAMRSLSMERAESVRARLVSDGVALDHIEAIGRGSEAPLSSTNPGSPENDRVELIVLEH